MAEAGKTLGEKTFESYMEMHGITDFVHEPVLAAGGRPDYKVRFTPDGQEHLFEVKDFDWRKTKELASYCSPKGIQEKINQGKKKFKNLKKSYPCSLVLYDPSPWQMFDERMGFARIWFAMYGPQFNGNGSMVIMNFQQPINQSINAVIALRRVDFGDRYLSCALAQLQESGEWEWREDWNYQRIHLGVTVYRNEFAKTPLPIDAFRGPYDEWFEFNRTQFGRIFVGDELSKLEAVEKEYWRNETLASISESDSSGFYDEP